MSGEYDPSIDKAPQQFDPVEQALSCGMQYLEGAPSNVLRVVQFTVEMIEITIISGDACKRHV